MPEQVKVKGVEKRIKTILTEAAKHPTDPEVQKYVEYLNSILKSFNELQNTPSNLDEMTQQAEDMMSAAIEYINGTYKTNLQQGGSSSKSKFSRKHNNRRLSGKNRKHTLKRLNKKHKTNKNRNINNIRKRTQKHN